LLKNWRFNRKCTEIGLRYGNRIWGITLNSLLQVYRKLPYPIPVALGIRYRTCSVFNNGYGTVPADTSFSKTKTIFLLFWTFHDICISLLTASPFYSTTVVHYWSQNAKLTGHSELDIVLRSAGHRTVPGYRKHAPVCIDKWQLHRTNS